MKRMLCACLAAVLLLVAGSAAVADEIDLSGLTLDELYEVREALDARILELESADDALCYEDGCYLVGRDLPEGDYVLVERQDAMFASVVVRAEESPDSLLILHKLVSGQADIHLSRDTWVTLSELKAWPMGAEPDARQPDGSVGEGAYLVGTQLPAGHYVAVPDAKAPLSSYSVCSGILGTDALQYKFVVLHDAESLELASGNYVELSGCTLSPEQ